MSKEIKNLWSPLIRPKVLSPRTILRAQASELPKMTGGLLEADIIEKDIITQGQKDPRTILSFDILAPSLNYRHHILSVAYRKNLPYPAVVEAEALDNSSSILRMFLEGSFLGGLSTWPNQANSDQELVLLLAKVLGSYQVLSITQSLIARATEIIEKGDREASSDLIIGDKGEAVLDSSLDQQDADTEVDKEKRSP